MDFITFIPQVGRVLSGPVMLTLRMRLQGVIFRDGETKGICLSLIYYLTDIIKILAVISIVPMFYSSHEFTVSVTTVSAKFD